MAFLDKKGLGKLWEKITEKVNTKSSKEHTHQYIPDGTVSTPEISVSTSTTVINEISSVGTLPEYTPASYNAPSYIAPSVSHTFNEETQTVRLQYISGAFSPGSFTEGVFKQGTLPEIREETVITSVNAESGALTFRGIAKTTSETNEN